MKKDKKILKRDVNMSEKEFHFLKDAYSFIGKGLSTFMRESALKEARKIEVESFGFRREK